jgi:hypothetical protein
MGVDMLILNSGEWLLAEELAAEPWHVLIYRDRAEPRNELHVWLPRAGGRRSADHAFRRYWTDGATRWCVELPPDPDRLRDSRSVPAASVRVRFTAPDGLTLWAEYGGVRRLADFTDGELRRLRSNGLAGPYSRL